MTTIAAKRRPRRIAADEAHSWARNLRLGNPLAKLVLSMLTIYVNGEGACFVSIEQLAEDCELVANTIRSRLAWLESIGAIVRFPQWVDEHGRRNGEGRGRRTTDEIRLLISADTDEIEAKAAGRLSDAGPSRDEGASADADPAPREGSDDGAPALAPHQPSNCVQGLTSEPEPEVRTPNPLSGGVQDSELVESFKPFAAAYPAPITDMGKALSVWAALTEPERTDAIIGAKGYRSYIAGERQRGGKRAVKDAHRWLRDKLWLGYLDAGKQFLSAQSAPRPVMVDRDSREGRAALVLFAVARTSPALTSDGERIVLKAPLTDQALALADAPDPAAWPLLDLPQEAGAWLELMMPLIGRAPLVEDHIVNKRFVTGADGKPVFAGNELKRGFKAPWPFPPRVDGTLPPMRDSPALSASDIEEFK